MNSLNRLQSVASDKTILYIEQDKVLQNNFGVYLKKIFKNFYQAFDGAEGFEKFIEKKPDIIVTDLDLMKKNAIELLADIKEIDTNVKIITLSTQNDDYSLLQSLDMGLDAMLIKPVNFSQLATTLIQVLPKIEVKPITVKVKKVEEVKRKPIPSKVEPSKVIKPIFSKVVPKSNTVAKKIEEKPKEKVKNVIEKKVEVSKAKDTENKKEKIVISKTCIEDIKEFLVKKEPITCINTYKGITIQNSAQIISCDETTFELKMPIAQLIATKYDKHNIMKINSTQKYVFSNLLSVDIKTNIIKLTAPKYINYKVRNASYSRVLSDKSFKASFFFNKLLINCTAKHISFDAVELFSNNDSLVIKPEMVLDLTFGFEVDSASVLIKERKFTKVFAKGKVIRIEKLKSGMNIIVSIEIQKSGQSSYRKYLKQREEEVIQELKNIIRRR